MQPYYSVKNRCERFTCLELNVLWKLHMFWEIQFIQVTTMGMKLNCINVWYPGHFWPSKLFVALQKVLVWSETNYRSKEKICLEKYWLDWQPQFLGLMSNFYSSFLRSFSINMPNYLNKIANFFVLNYSK